MRLASLSILAVAAFVPTGADAAPRWTESFKQGIGEFIIRADRGTRFMVSCPSGLEKTNPGFTLESSKIKVPEGETQRLSLSLVIDRDSQGYSVECSGNACEWTSPDAAGQKAIETSIARLRAAKRFVVRIPDLKIVQHFSTLGARKALENALEGCES